VSELVIADCEGVFSDTCVLLRYVLDDDENPSQRVLLYDPCEVYVSGKVKAEFSSVYRAREYILKGLVEAAEEGNVQGYSPSDKVYISDNNRRWLNDFREEMSQLPEPKAVLRILEKQSQLDEGKKRLFEDDDSIVTVTPSLERDATLVGYLEAVTRNDDDAQVIADAVEWNREGGSGVMLTTDQDDILGNGEEGEEEVESASTVDDDGLPTFEGLFETDLPLPEQINEEIRKWYDDDATLAFMLPEKFLQQRT